MFFGPDEAVHQEQMAFEEELLQWAVAHAKERGFDSQTVFAACVNLAMTMIHAAQEPERGDLMLGLIQSLGNNFGSVVGVNIEDEHRGPTKH